MGSPRLAEWIIHKDYDDSSDTARKPYSSDS